MVDKQDLRGVIGEFVTESKATNDFAQNYMTLSQYASDQCRCRTQAKEDPKEEESGEEEAEDDWAGAEAKQCQSSVAFDQWCEDQRWLLFLKQNGQEESENEESEDAEEAQEAEPKEEETGDHNDVQREQDESNTEEEIQDSEVKPCKLQKSEKRKLKKKQTNSAKSA
jgi:hypothetical protein